MLRRIIGYAVLLSIIAYASRYYIAPIVICWQEGGTWSNHNETCHMGTYDISGGDLINPRLKDVSERISEHINPTMLEKIEINIPNGEETSATLARTNGALARFIASFPQPGTDIEGYAEAEGAAAVLDDVSGLALVPFFVNYGGTGSFVYVGLFRSGTSTFEHLDSIMVGDRISVDRVLFERSGQSLKAVILYKDRAPDDAMAVAPTVPKKAVVPITDSSFGEPTVYDRTIDYTATYKDVLKLEMPAPEQTVNAPLTVRGIARGTWFFEASFPILVTDWDGKIIGEGHAEAIGDWMTEEYVPFMAAVPFSVPSDAPYRRGTLILKKDNPSGLPEHDDAFEVPVNF